MKTPTGLECFEDIFIKTLTKEEKNILSQSKYQVNDDEIKNRMIFFPNGTKLIMVDGNGGTKVIFYDRQGQIVEQTKHSYSFNVFKHNSGTPGQGNTKTEDTIRLMLTLATDIGLKQYKIEKSQKDIIKGVDMTCDMLKHFTPEEQKQILQQVQVKMATYNTSALQQLQTDNLHSVNNNVNHGTINQNHKLQK